MLGRNESIFVNIAIGLYTALALSPSTLSNDEFRVKLGCVTGKQLVICILTGAEQFTIT